MPMEVVTKDTTAISDAELAEMADLCADREPRFDIGYLSKVREEWVLITTAREGNKLRGYSFSTLERIGGTPCLLVGLALIDRNSKSEQALKSVLADQFRRALLAFPDEEVLLGTRLLNTDGFRALQGLEEIVPRILCRSRGALRRWRRAVLRLGRCREGAPARRLRLGDARGSRSRSPDPLAHPGAQLLGRMATQVL